MFGNVTANIRHTESEVKWLEDIFDVSQSVDDQIILNRAQDHLFRYLAENEER